MAAPARSGWQGNKVGSHDGVRLGRLSRRDTPCIVFCRFLFSSADRLLGFIFYHDLCFLSCVLSAAGRGMYYRRSDDDECLLRIACSKPSLSPGYASFYFGDVLCWCVVVGGGGGCCFFFARVLRRVLSEHQGGTADGYSSKAPAFSWLEQVMIDGICDGFL